MAKVESNTGVLPLVLYPAVFPLRGENTGLPGDPNALRREGGRDERVKMADGGPFSFWSGGGGARKGERASLRPCMFCEARGIRNCLTCSGYSESRH